MKLVHIHSRFKKGDFWLASKVHQIKQEHVKITNVQIFCQFVDGMFKVYQLHKLLGLMKKNKIEI